MDVFYAKSMANHGLIAWVNGIFELADPLIILVVRQ